jgi:hypothetical protein
MLLQQPCTSAGSHHSIGDAKIPGEAGDAILGAATTISRLDREFETLAQRLSRFSA